MITSSDGTDVTWHRIKNTDTTASSGDILVGYYDRGLAFYDPQPVEVQISMPKKQRVLHLERAKIKEQLKVWGLRKK